MSYIVLARKWRPQTFEQVIGQSHVTRTLMNALLRDRIAHAYLFAGPRGVGKTTTARLLAKAVNCTRRQGASPCNQCPSCQSITAGTSMDVIEIDGASNRGIDEIRNLRENIRFAPAEGKYKIYIIDEVHMLSKDAFNALLKTLEEPPAHAIFVFATTEVHKVPQTILSRCQRFDFKRISTREIAAQLEQICQSEQIEIEPESLLLIARKADGSMRDAQSILDQMISYTDGKITVQSVQESLGLIEEELFFEYSQLMQQQNDQAILNYARKIYHSGHDLLDFLYGLQEHFRNLLLARAEGGAQLIDTSDHFRERYTQHAQQFTEADLIHYLELLVQHEQTLKFSPNPLLILELLLLKLAHKPRTADLAELLDLLKKQPVSGGGDSVPPQASPSQRQSAPSAGSPGAASGKAGAPARSTAAGFPPVPEKPPLQVRESNSAPPALEEIQKNWARLISVVQNEKIALASFLEAGVPHRLQGQTLEIAFDRKARFHREHVKNNQRFIESALQEVFGYPLRIRCVEIDFQKAGIEKTIHSAEEILEDLRKKEPVLNKLIDLFACEQWQRSNT